MPIAFVQEFDVQPGETQVTTNYDAIATRLREQNPTPDGLIVHTAGYTPDNVFRVFAIWESEDDLQRFMNEQLMPAVQAVTEQAEGALAQPARQYTYELHDIQRGA